MSSVSRSSGVWRGTGGSFLRARLGAGAVSAGGVGLVVSAGGVSSSLLLELELELLELELPELPASWKPVGLADAGAGGGVLVDGCGALVDGWGASRVVPGWLTSGTDVSPGNGNFCAVLGGGAVVDGAAWVGVCIHLGSITPPCGAVAQSSCLLCACAITGSANKPAAIHTVNLVRPIPLY